VNSIKTIPALQHDELKPEDVDTEGDDHCGDAARYACMSRPYIKSPIVQKPKPKQLAYEVKDGRIQSNMSIMEIVQQRMRRKRLG
jgi:hypothetical protein